MQKKKIIKNIIRIILSFSIVPCEFGPSALVMPSGQQPNWYVWQAQPWYRGPEAGVKLSGQHLCSVYWQLQPELFGPLAVVVLSGQHPNGV